jgi:hypothetical protein
MPLTPFLMTISSPLLLILVIDSSGALARPQLTSQKLDYVEFLVSSRLILGFAPMNSWSLGSR